MQGLVVDAAERRRNPVRKLSRLGHPAAHQRLHEGVVLRTWQPFEFMLFPRLFGQCFAFGADEQAWKKRSEEHTSELQSRGHLVCRLLLEKKKKKKRHNKNQ